MSTSRSQLEQVYEDLAAPSAKVFLQALRARNIQVRAVDVRTFLASKSERQIQQPGNRFSGKVVAFSENDRWGTDVISFVAKPAVKDGKRYSYILIVQDFFTRRIWTAPMVKLEEVPERFVAIVGDTPVREVVCDRATEYRSSKFQQACKKLDILINYKNSNDQNGPTARLDAAIHRLRRSLVRLQELGKGTNWVEVLEKATIAYNNSHHESTETTPLNMPDSARLEQKKLNATNARHNDREIRARKAKLLKLKGFRVLREKASNIRNRAEAELWSRRIHLVTSFPIASKVEDEDGNVYDTKQTLAVATDSSQLADQIVSYTERLRAIAVQLQATVEDAPNTLLEAMKLLPRATGVAKLLKAAGKTPKALVNDNPDLFRKVGKKIIAKAPAESDEEIAARPES